MRNLNIALRSLFKKERHNMTKILSLSVGLAVALGCAVSFFVSEFWMRQFAEKAPLSLWIFVAGGAGVGLVVTACVIYRTWKAAGEDPVRNLKSE